MPNWCSNTLTLTHEDLDQIARAVAGFKNGRLLDELVPMPNSTRDSDAWYDWAVNNWGTKWDVGGEDYEPEVSNNGHSVTFSFDSAWSPPLTAYESMMDLGFEVEGMYYEPGMAFAGIWSNGSDDYYDLSEMNNQEVEDALPSMLNDCFAISEMMYDNEDEEPLTEWYVDGAREKGLIKDE